MVCPPVMIWSTPSSVKISFIPSPTETAIKPYFFLGCAFFSSACCAASFSASLISFSWCSSLILSIFIFDNWPKVRAFWIASPGSFVWTWILTTSSSATHTIESPIDSKYALKETSSFSENSLSSRIINSVQYPNLISAAASVFTFAATEGVPGVIAE